MKSNLQPIVNLDGFDSLNQSFIKIRIISMIEPDCEQPKEKQNNVIQTDNAEIRQKASLYWISLASDGHSIFFCSKVKILLLNK